MKFIEDIINESSSNILESNILESKTRLYHNDRYFLDFERAEVLTRHFVQNYFHRLLLLSHRAHQLAFCNLLAVSLLRARQTRPGTVMQNFSIKNLHCRSLK